MSSNLHVYSGQENNNPSFDLLFWLQKWIYNRYKQHSPCKVFITTIDNPGWGVTVNLASHIIKKLPIADVENSQNDWYYCTIKKNRFEGDGGLFNLKNILREFKKLVGANNDENFIDEEIINDDLSWLLLWFATECNGDWEHGYGIRISTLDKPGWSFRVSLIATELENKAFERTVTKRSQNDWLFCSIEKGHFEGACGIFNLSEVLKIFREWATST
jgi:hypothetical protein